MYIVFCVCPVSLALALALSVSALFLSFSLSLCQTRHLSQEKVTPSGKGKETLTVAGKLSLPRTAQNLNLSARAREKTSEVLSKCEEAMETGTMQFHHAKKEQMRCRN